MKQNIIIAIISICAVMLIGIIVFSNAYKPSLGGIAEGDYTMMTSTGGAETVICHAPCVLHKVITSAAADLFGIRDSATTGSGDTAFQLTVVSPDEVDFNMNMVEGLTAYVTSTGGVIFVTSPR